MAKNLAKFSSCVLCKAEHVSNEIRYLAEISKPSVEGTSCFLPTAYSKTQEEGDKSTGLLSKKKSDEKIWESLSIHIGEGNGTPLQYSCLENPMDGGAW